MDVGNPSNFSRMLDLYDGSQAKMKNDIFGFSFTDETTSSVMKKVLKEKNYLLDPHGAVGYLGLQKYFEKNPNTKGIFLETAHPAKFADVVERILDMKVDLPEQLQSLLDKEKQARLMTTEFSLFKEYLLSR